MEVERSGEEREVEVPAPLEAALSHLASLQGPHGFWEGEMVWNSMLLSQYVLTRRILSSAPAHAARWPIPDDERQLILHHYRTTQLVDGSWPMHGEGPGYVYMTSLAYVALRVLGLGADDPMVASARAWLRAQPGGLLAVPSWGKFWLALVGLYGWEGVNPIPPELFLVPDALPIHPNNFYCHTRYIYLGIAFLYGTRYTFDLGPLGDSLRRELYEEPWERLDFRRERHALSAGDLFVRPSLPLRLAWDSLSVYERRPNQALRRRALDHCLGRIRYEIEASRGQGISPVNGLLNCLALFVTDPSDPALGPAFDAMESWRWRDEVEGIRYCGAHSTAWDTAFSLRAMLASPVVSGHEEALRRGYLWLVETQLIEELPDHAREARDSIVGGWCFSDGQHRWPVSDCTAEALTALLELHERSEQILRPGERISDSRLVQAVEFILARQNDDGGFGSYERRRGSQLLEWVNPSEMYGNCMTERSYTECTASCVGALARFRRHYPEVLRARIDRAITAAVALLRARQRDDGSWVGFWGVNFTYAIFHVTEALLAAGVPASDTALQRAARWLLGRQRADGGWGEHYSSCLTEEYVEHPESQAAMTAWALLALVETLGPGHLSVERARLCLERLQLVQPVDETTAPSRPGMLPRLPVGAGGWPHQAQAGVFFSTAMLDYRLYKDLFPTWALGRHAALALHLRRN